MPQTPTDNSPNRRARKWQVLSLSSGLLLAACFFMPAVQSCNTPVVPAYDAYSTLKEIGVPSSLPSLKECSEFGMGFLLFFAAYSFGFLAACCAATRLVRSRTWQRIL